jgi:hypothetical protein
MLGINWCMQVLPTNFEKKKSHTQLNKKILVYLISARFPSERDSLAWLLLTLVNIKRFFKTWVLLNLIRTIPNSTILRNFIKLHGVQPLSYRNFGRVKFLHTIHLKLVNFSLRYIFLNLGTKFGTHIDTCILYMHKIYLKFFKVRNCEIRIATVIRDHQHLGAAVHFVRVRIPSPSFVLRWWMGNRKRRGAKNVS